MAHDRTRPLPKFGEWDVNNPASADGFTVIFAKARDEKKATGTAVGGAPAQMPDHNRPPQGYQQNSSPTPNMATKWFCCF